MPKTVVKKVNVSQSKRPNGFLALRVGKGKDVDSKDPIKEIDAVLKIKGVAYFAKFGKNVGKLRVNRLLLNTNPHLVLLCFNGGKYEAKTYKLLDVIEEQPKDSTLYPKYYKSKLKFVGSWLKIQKSDTQVSVESLIVTSSYQKLTNVMASAMGSSFFCTTNS
jgi:hypothetical protein